MAIDIIIILLLLDIQEISRELKYQLLDLQKHPTSIKYY